MVQRNDNRNVSVAAATDLLAVFDDDFTIKNDDDPTKVIRFELGDNTTGTTRIIKPPNANATLVGLDTADTLTNKTFGDEVSIVGSIAGGLAVMGQHYNHVVLAVGYNNNSQPLTQPSQVGMYSALYGNANCNGAGSAIIGFEAAIGTIAGSQTVERSIGLSLASISKGAGTTITRSIGIGMVNETAGTNNAFIANDGAAFTGDWFIYYTGTRPSLLGGSLTVSGDLTFSGATEIGNDVGTSYVRLWGGTSSGASVLAYGATHATNASQLFLNGASGVTVTGATNFSTNVGIGTSTFGASATKTLALFNGTAPTTSPADTVQLFSADISAGNASLGIRTETAVVTESVVSDRTLSVTINGTVYKICLKA